jgi:hypothetical protein
MEEKQQRPGREHKVVSLPIDGLMDLQKKISRLPDMRFTKVIKPGAQATIKIGNNKKRQLRKNYMTAQVRICD